MDEVVELKGAFKAEPVKIIFNVLQPKSQIQFTKGKVSHCDEWDIVKSSLLHKINSGFVLWHWQEKLSAYRR